MPGLRTLAAAIGTIAVLTLVSVVSAGATVSAIKRCGTVKVRSASYRVEVNGAVTCTFARLWAKRLAPLPGKVGSNGVLRIPKHPPGFTCGGTPFNDDSFPYQDQGGCRTVKPGPNSFEWNLNY